MITRQEFGAGSMRATVDYAELNAAQPVIQIELPKVLWG
ncbi:MAG: hypothetical protein N838_21760 [Thiohalocapsa sp. PB-PSB1]|jgi:hypothetical protein|nr:MAG: hypothetical protein N838_21760 [Thiohalocapsa sp. PB-PSB1]